MTNLSDLRSVSPAYIRAREQAAERENDRRAWLSEYEMPNEPCRDRSWLVIALPMALFILLAVGGYALAGERISGPARPRDGDTIVVSGTPVRLSGVAAPERSEPGGAEATAAMVRMIAGRIVTCELNGQRTHDRMVGICYVDGVDVGEAIIAAGFARDCPRFSKGRYQHAETEASRRQPFPAYCRPR